MKLKKRKPPVGVYARLVSFILKAFTFWLRPFLALPAKKRSYIGLVQSAIFFSAVIFFMRTDWLGFNTYAKTFLGGILMGGYTLLLMSGAAGTLFLYTLLISPDSLYTNRKLQKEGSEVGRFTKHSLLRIFYWFCGKANREIVQLAIADLKRDEKEMKKEGRGFWFIKAVVFWRTIATIMPIAWDGIVRVVKAITPFAKYFKG